MFLCRFNEASGADEYLNLAAVEAVEYDGAGPEPIAVLHFASRDVWVYGDDAKRVADWCCDRDPRYRRRRGRNQ